MMSGGELLGDPAQKITGAASLAEATDGDVSFFGTPKYVAQLRKTRASAVFVPLDFSSFYPLEAPDVSGLSLFAVLPSPYRSFLS